LVKDKDAGMSMTKVTLLDLILFHATSEKPTDESKPDKDQDGEFGA
jgi:hypothetical protein